MQFHPLKQSSPFNPLTYVITDTDDEVILRDKTKMRSFCEVESGVEGLEEGLEEVFEGLENGERRGERGVEEEGVMASCCCCPHRSKKLYVTKHKKMKKRRRSCMSLSNCWDFCVVSPL